MAEFKIKTKNEANIKDKPRVYFTCHPSDFGTHYKANRRDQKDSLKGTYYDN